MLELETGLPVVDLGFRSFRHPSLLACLCRISTYVRHYKIKIVQTFFQDATLLAALSRPLHGARLVGSFRDLGFWRTSAETRKMRLAYPLFSSFIANSQAVKNHFVHVDGIRPEKIEVIYNGIDLESVEPRIQPKANQEPAIVGIVANLNRPVKRVQDFIQAAAVVHQDFPGVHFVIIGDGYLRGRLEDLRASLALDAALEFAGLVSDPLKVIPRFDIGVITSESEGFCNAILEYMACGVPVIATDTGGNPELIHEGKNGFLYPVGNTDTLADKIVTLLKDKQLRQAISNNNIAKIHNEYSISRLLQRHYAFYEKVLNNGWP